MKPSPTSWSARPGERRRAAEWRPPARSSRARLSSPSTRQSRRGGHLERQRPNSSPGPPRRRSRSWPPPQTGRSRSSTARMLQRLHGQIALDLQTCRRRRAAAARRSQAARDARSSPGTRDLPRGAPGGERRRSPGRRRAGRRQGRSQGAPARPGARMSHRPAARRSGHPLHGWLRRKRVGSQAGARRRSRGARTCRAGRALAVARSSRRP